MTRYLFVFSLMFCLSTAAARAQDNAPISQKDNIDYTLDDGVMSEHEMEEEARTIQSMCANNVFQSQYFDCDCIGGAFLEKREKLGAMVSETDIYNSITNNTTHGQCANTPVIAGNAYQSCLAQSQIYRELATDNKDYCQCTANKLAKDFANRPFLNSGYIENLQVAAMDYCSDPNHRQTTRK